MLSGAMAKSYILKRNYPIFCDLQLLHSRYCIPTEDDENSKDDNYLESAERCLKAQHVVAVDPNRTSPNFKNKVGTSKLIIYAT
jgi:hypothetical protein